jgi:signal transduction histidine kinase
MRGSDKQKNRRWWKLFIAVSVLVVAQVVWWTAAFLRDVDVIANLKTANAQFSNSSVLPDKIKTISDEAFHRRVMFLSESIFFLTMSCLGMYLMVRALRAEERAMEIQRNFVEIVSHESRTPLTALKLRLESITEKREADPELSRELGLAREEVKRLSALFEKALSLNRLEREAFRFEQIYLTDAIREVTHRMEPLFREKKVSLSTQLDPDAAVMGDIHAIQNLLQSLLENAVFYNDTTDKTLRIEVKGDPGLALVVVEDNGPGIVEGERGRIFDRFFRGTASKKVPGSGLGLYLARRLAEAHGGTIQYVPIAKGSRFEVILPRRVDKADKL